MWVILPVTEANEMLAWVNIIRSFRHAAVLGDGVCVHACGVEPGMPAVCLLAVVMFVCVEAKTHRNMKKIPWQSN